MMVMTMTPGQGSTGPPQYKLPKPQLAWLGVDLLLGRRRSLLRDCETFLRTNPYPRRVEGTEHVPASPPFVIVANHYGRAGLKPYHSGMVLTGALAQARPAVSHVRFVITSEWFGRRLGPVPIPPAVYRWTFRRVAKLYGSAIMPRRTGEVAARAAVLRGIVRALRHEVVGLMPEAGGSGTLRAPLDGSGLFIASLAKRGIPIVPAGLWEDGDTLVVSFGPPLTLTPVGEDRQGQDRTSAEQVMVAIGRLLPERQWGVYREAVKRSLGGI